MHTSEAMGPREDSKVLVIVSEKVSRVYDSIDELLPFNTPLKFARRGKW